MTVIDFNEMLKVVRDFHEGTIRLVSLGRLRPFDLFTGESRVDLAQNALATCDAAETGDATARQRVEFRYNAILRSNARAAARMDRLS